MGFKSNREFLRNVTVGAVGTRQVALLLKSGGCQIIELERYSQSNKIWLTKVKRLRVPDLLCLRCGTRIESRAKSDLEIRMSHAKNNPDRAWDKGLRDRDLVAFIRCVVNDDINWIASDELALFRVADLRATVHLAKESQMKAASEGSEVFLTWPACVPSTPGTVTAVLPDAIKVQFDGGRTYTYKMKRGTTALTPYVVPTDRFGQASRIIASVLPKVVPVKCTSSGQYDFIADLKSSERETVYAAVKALGFLPALRSLSTPELEAVIQQHSDNLVRLEAAASLSRLDVDTGWQFLRNAAISSAGDDYRMETVLILGELHSAKSVAILQDVSLSQSAPSEVRAAATWGLGGIGQSTLNAALLQLVADKDELVAVHSIMATSRLINPTTLPVLLNSLGADARVSAGIVQAIQFYKDDPIPEIVNAVQTAAAPVRPWLLYLLSRLGRARCGAAIAHVPGLAQELEFFWTYHVENWTNRTDVSDQVEFLRQQMLD